MYSHKGGFDNKETRRFPDGSYEVTTINNHGLSMKVFYPHKDIKFSGQCTNLSRFLQYSRGKCIWAHGRFKSNIIGYICRSCFYGCQYIYWKCTQFYGEINFRIIRNWNAILFWIFIQMVITNFNSSIYFSKLYILLTRNLRTDYFSVLFNLI